MEDDLRIHGEASDSAGYARGSIDTFAATVNSVQPATCALCCRVFSPDNPATGDYNLCGDCKFLCLENLENPAQDSPHMRTSRRRRRGGRRTSRYSSSESVEDLFSQQFSQMISVMRQNHAVSYEHEEQHAEVEASVRSWQQNSSRSTPSGSRRWHRMLSDSESDGFDNMDSLYGESESNFSYNPYRTFHGESDAVSMSTYGGDSDASIDEQSYVETDVLARANVDGELDSDTDIDPMNAGLSQWELDNQEEDEGQEEEDEQSEWVETDAEENTVESPDRADHNGNSSGSAQLAGELFVFSDFEGVVRLRFRGRTHDYSRAITSNMVELGAPSYEGNSGDYLDARGFEELLEHLAENDNSRRGAPPASVSCINSLPLVTVNEHHLKLDSISCAICKDTMTVGTIANQLPCSHVYHPSCILPWLSSRNSCPLCRYELPTDDKDYEESKQASIRRMHDVEENRLQRVVEAIPNREAEATEEQEPSLGDVERTEVPVGSPPTSSRSRWFHHAATPILGIVGMALVLWLGKPLIQRGQAASNLNIFYTGRPRSNVLDAAAAQREHRSRRWWAFF